MSGIINRLADVGDAPNYSRAKIAKAASKLNANLTDPMTFTQANNGKVNPFFDSGLDEHTKNCQRCAVAFEMRMRGLDVYAGDYRGAGDLFFVGIDPYASEVWVNSTTHKPPQKSEIRLGTLSDALAAFNEATKESGRYILYVAWASGSAHNFNFIRNKRKQGFFYDGQPTSEMYKNFEYYYNSSKIQTSALQVWRVDDCDLEENYVSDYILKTYEN